MVFGSLERSLTITGLNEEWGGSGGHHFFEFVVWCMAVYNLHIISAIESPDWAVIDSGKRSTLRLSLEPVYIVHGNFPST